MLDAENDAALGMLCCNHAITSTGAQYNTEILTQSHMVVDQLKTQWPDIAEEDPLRWVRVQERCLGRNEVHVNDIWGAL